MIAALPAFAVARWLLSTGGGRLAGPLKGKMVQGDRDMVMVGIVGLLGLVAVIVLGALFVARFGLAFSAKNCK